LRAIEYFAPSSVKEAVSLLAEKGEAARVLAGGTDIIVQLNGRRRSADRLVDVKTVPEANVLEFSARKGLVVGAAVPCYRIYKEAAIARNYPGLVDSASIIGSVQIQGRATLAGNLCNAAPSADAVPSMVALGGVAVVVGPQGTRRVPVEQFCIGPGRTVLKPGELVLSLEFPAPKPNSGSRYLRFIPRNEMDIAVAGVGAWVQLDDSKRRILAARICLAAVAPTPLFVEAAGKALEGKQISDQAIEEAATIARDAAKPIVDMRGTVEHRKQLVYVLTKRALQGAIQRAKEAR